MDEWQYVFGIGAMAYIAPAIIFIIFGSGEVQKWNDKKEAADEVRATWSDKSSLFLAQRVKLDAASTFLDKLRCGIKVTSNSVT